MALTKVTGQVIKNTTDVTVGVLTVTNTLAVGGTVSIGGTLTYEDVTNVDAVGLVTARNGIVVGSGITLSKDGDVFFTGIATGNGSGLTALNASNLGSGTVPTARLGSGTASSSTFLRGDSTFATVTSTTINNNADNRLITGSGTANTLEAEANITFDGTNLDLGDSKKIRLGASQDLEIFHDGTYNKIESAGSTQLLIRGNGGTIIADAGGNNMIKTIDGGAVELYYDSTKRFETTSSGATVTGQFNVAGVLKFDNNVNSGLDIRFEPSTNSLDFVDNVKAQFGTGDDLSIYHNGTHNYLDSSNGNIYLRVNGTENAIKCTENGNVEISYDATKKFETTSAGVCINNSDQPTNGALVVKIDTNKHIGMSGSQSEVGDVPALVAFQDNGALQDIGFRGSSVRFAAGNAERGRFTDDGLTFNGDTASANALDDYEEGTWTPDLRFGSGSTGLTYDSNSRHGEYTRVGNLVTFTFRFTLTNRGSSSGSAQVYGLPFNCASGNGNYSGVSFGYLAGLTNSSRWSAYQVPTIDTNASYIFFRYVITGTDYALNHDDASFTNSTDVIGRGFYYAS